MIPHRVNPSWVLSSADEVRGLLEHLMELPRDRVLSFDTEWVDFTQERSQVNNGRAACLTLAWFEDEACTTIQPVFVYTLDEFADNLEILRPLFQDPERVWCAHYAQVDWHMLMNHGVNIAGDIRCTLVMDFFFDENRENAHDLKSCMVDHFGEDRLPFAHVFGAVRLRKDGVPYASGQRDVPSLRDVVNEEGGFAKLVTYAVQDAIDGLALHFKYQAFLKSQPWKGELSMWDYFLSVEVPITKEICKAEREGMPLDLPYLRLMRSRAERDLSDLLGKVTAIVGCPVNPSSDKQMRHLIYGSGGLDITKGTGKNLRVLYTIPGLGFPVYKTTDTGLPSLNKDAISDLIWRYENDWSDEERASYDESSIELLRTLAGYSAIETQLSTFLFGLEEKALESRVHTRLIHAGPTSGRFACVDGDTPMVTLRGVVTIRNVVVGDRLMTHKGRWRRVLATYTKGPQRMINLHLSNGEILTCTTDHRLLTQEGTWKTVQEVLNERERLLDADTKQHRESCRDVQVARTADYRGYCSGAGYDLSHGLYRTEGEHSSCGAEGFGSSPLFEVQAGREEPHAREEGHCPPTLGGGVRRRTGLPDLPAQRQAGVCSPCRDGERPRSCSCPLFAARPPHRRRPEEQRPGQPGPGYTDWSQGDPQSGDAGFCGACAAAADSTHCGLRPQPALAGPHGPVHLEAYTEAGIREVYDLTVEEDESYLACGVYSHNSRSPNIQNISAGDKDIYNLRDCFASPEGLVFLVIDFNQLEYRLLAHITRDPALLKAFNDNLDLHGITHYGSFPFVKTAVDAHFGRPLDLDHMSLDEIKTILKWIKSEFEDTRKYAKILNFETIYGVGPTKLAEQLRITKDEAWDRLKGWHRMYPGVRRWQEAELRLARERGFIRTLAGRYRRPVMWRLNHQENRIRGAEERSILNAKVQGSARDVAVRAMLALARDAAFQACEPRFINQVHDELVYLVPTNKARRALAIAQEKLNNGLFPTPLRVPLPVSAGVGPSWGSAKC